MSGGKIVRKRERKGDRITLPVSSSTKSKWEEIGKGLSEKGYEIDTDQVIRRIIRSLEPVLNEGAR